MLDSEGLHRSDQAQPPENFFSWIRARPGAAVGVSLHESVVARGAPLVLLRKDTVALVVDTHRVHLRSSGPRSRIGRRTKNKTN